MVSKCTSRSLSTLLNHPLLLLDSRGYNGSSTDHKLLIHSRKLVSERGAERRDRSIASVHGAGTCPLGQLAPFHVAALSTHPFEKAIKLLAGRPATSCSSVAMHGICLLAPRWHAYLMLRKERSGLYACTCVRMWLTPLVAWYLPAKWNRQDQPAHTPQSGTSELLPSSFLDLVFSFPVLLSGLSGLFPSLSLLLAILAGGYERVEPPVV
eukprot:358016-Chlamydomonas_euryale.AAC.4